MFLFLIDKFVLKHQGHCAAGWTDPNTNQDNLEQCFMECESRHNIGYFAFNSKTGGCSCYSIADGCPDDDLYNDYNTYRIIQSNFQIASVVYFW